MRAYYFNLMYQSGVQLGIQAGHAKDEMWLKYGGTSAIRPKWKMMVEHARNHKTSIVLNGGDSTALRSLVELFKSQRNPYPWAFFEEPGMDGCITSVAIIIPEKLYDQASTDAGRSVDSNLPYTQWEIDFLKRRVVCDLAR